MTFRHAKEGYLLIDNRESPGVSPEFVHRSGQNAPIATSGTLYESATITCCHCNRVVILNPDRKRPRGYCAKCDHYVCDSSACGLNCTPFRKLIEQLQEQAARKLILP